MNETRNEQLVQERERKLRASNVIAHGVIEGNDENNIDDEEFIDPLFGKIGVDITPQSMIRLGRQDQNKNRPLRIKMINENEKNKIMSRLSNLKDAEDRFKKISVTDDYTVEERQEIKCWVDKAKEKTESEDGKFVWKVRGSQKEQMRLVRFTKR